MGANSQIYEMRVENRKERIKDERVTTSSYGGNVYMRDNDSEHVNIFREAVFMKCRLHNKIVEKPRALLLGDSISMGYRELVKKKLSDKVTVLYPDENQKMVAYAFRSLYEWKRDYNWSDIDLVYFNFGMWDVVHVYGDECQTSLNNLGKFQV